jgi:hypothetical protein
METKMTLKRAAIFLGISATIFGLSAATAQTPPAQARPTDAIYACADKTDDAERLACFDAAVAAFKTAETTGAVKTVDVAAIEKIERDSFGFSLPSLTEIFRREEPGKEAMAAPVAEVALAIASISVNKVTGKALIRLENGQVWEQVDSEVVSRSKVRKAKVATIRKAAMGSFLMGLDGGTAIRVRRVN